MKKLKKLLLFIFISFSCLIYGQKDSLNILSSKLQFFNSKSIDLRKESYKALDSIAIIIENNKSYYEIESHSSMRNSTEFNIEKTQKRAELIKRELVKRGIETLRLIPVGYGESNLINYDLPSVRDKDTINERILIRKVIKH